MKKMVTEKLAITAAIVVLCLLDTKKPNHHLITDIRKIMRKILLVRLTNTILSRDCDKRRGLNW